MMRTVRRDLRDFGFVYGSVVVLVVVAFAVVATEGGLTRYRPRRTSPAVRLTDVVADRRYGAVAEVRLQQSQQFVSFEFQGRSLSTGPGRMAYVYRLSGRDEEWQPTYERRVDYHDLPLGDFTFEVKAVDRDLNYSAPACVRLQVVPDERDQRIDELERRVRERTAELEAANARLAARTREAEIETALERVRAEVASMEQSDDIGRVMGLVFTGIRELGVDTDSGVVLVIDEETESIREYGMIPRSFYGQGLEGRPVVPSVVEGVDLYRGDRPFHRGEDRAVEVWKTQQSQLDRGLDKGREHLLQSQKTVEKQFDFSIPLELIPVSTIMIPFSHGSLLFNSSKKDAFSEEDRAVAEDFGRMVSLGYSRYLDFQRLEESNRQIQEANRHKSDFLARMSHDLRTPMNAIIGYTRILLRRAKDKLEPRQFRNLENIETSAQHLLTLINEILDLSRIEAGRVEVKPEDVDLKRLVSECATSIAPLGDSAGMFDIDAMTAVLDGLPALVEELASQV